MGEKAPETPIVEYHSLGQEGYISLEPGDDTEVRTWAIRIRKGRKWETQILGGHERTFGIDADANAVIVEAVGRLGLTSPSVGMLVK